MGSRDQCRSEAHTIWTYVTLWLRILSPKAGFMYMVRVLRTSFLSTRKSTIFRDTTIKNIYLCVYEETAVGTPSRCVCPM
jgi:hypothetical protein